MKPLIITGTPGQGLDYAYHVFKESGYAIGFEEIYSGGGCGFFYLDPNVHQFFRTTVPDLFNGDYNFLHIIEHPVQAIANMQKTISATFHNRWMRNFLGKPFGVGLYERYMEFYLRWNILAKEKADLTILAEDLAAAKAYTLYIIPKKLSHSIQESALKSISYNNSSNQTALTWERMKAENEILCVEIANFAKDNGISVPYRYLG